MLYLNSDLLPVNRDGTPLRLPAELPVDVSIYHEFRENDDEIKARLPEVVWNALGTAAEADDRGRPWLARQLVFCHLYGRYDLQVMKMHRDGIFYVKPRSELVHASRQLFWDDDMLSCSASRIEAPRRVLGNADKELVLAMPSRMAKDIKRVAKLINRTNGRTLRMILIRELFGRRFAVEKPVHPENSSDM